MNTLNGKTALFKSAVVVFVVLMGMLAILPNNALAQFSGWMRCSFGSRDICFSDGNVGIGTTTPEATLDVAGTGVFADTLTFSKAGFGETIISVSDPNIQFINLSNDSIYGVHELVFNDPGTNEGIRWDYTAAEIFVSPLDGPSDPPVPFIDDGYLRLINDGGIVFEPGAENVEAMTLNADGKIGIGTTEPNSKLEVTDGYIELDTSDGRPPDNDCDSPDEVGRMVVDSTRPYLYVCMAQGWARK